MNPVELIDHVRSGIAQISLERERERISSGSAFLVEGGLVTNSHNIRSFRFEALAIRFADTDPNRPESYVRLPPESLDRVVAAESQEGEKDYVYLKLWEPEFEGRHIFEFVDSSVLSVGQQIVFLGFPFGMYQLTSHIGYVSSIYERNMVKIIQIDGSVNGGNSGGPLLELETGRVAGIVTRAVTGLIEEQFLHLIEALQKNQIVLRQSRSRGSISFAVGGVDIDPLQAIEVSQHAMERIAQNLRRSANVGIGYAYSANYVRDHVAEVLKR